MRTVRHKKLALGTLLIFSTVIVMFLTAFSQTILQTVNPVAALTAVTVAVIGIAWFKKTSG